MMKRQTRSLFFVFLFLASAFGFQASALAACANPVGSEGHMMYNSTSHVMQFCNNANNWIQMGTTTGIASDVTAGLILDWPFDEGAGTSTTDSTGGGYTGTLTNGPTWISGQFGAGAITFDGSNDFVNGANSTLANFAITNTFSVSAWINRTTNTTLDTIVSKRHWDGAAFTGWTFEADSGANTLSVKLAGNTNTCVAFTGAVIGTGAWYHVVMTYDGSSSCGGVKIYVNGASQSMSVGGILGGTMTTTEKINVGAEQGGAASWFIGSIDDVRIYNTTLSAGEVTQLYQATGGGSCSNPSGSEGDLMFNDTYAVPQYCNGYVWIAMGPADTGAASAADYTTNLVGWWKLDDGAGTNATDSANSNDGTLKPAASEPTWGTGKINGDLVFDGNNDYVDIANESNFDFERTTRFSVAAWFKRTSTATEDAIIGKTSSSTTWRGWSLWMWPGGGNVEMDMTNDSTAGCSPTCNTSSAWTASGATSTGTWTHVVMTHDNTATAANLKIYINGVSQSISTSATNVSATILNNTDVKIGTDFPAVGDEFLGQLDDVRVYNSTLSAAQALQIYNAALQVCASPVGAQGDIMYNSTSHIMQYCAGGAWVKMGGP